MYAWFSGSQGAHVLFSHNRNKEWRAVASLEDYRTFGSTWEQRSEGRLHTNVPALKSSARRLAAGRQAGSLGSLIPGLFLQSVFVTFGKSNRLAISDKHSFERKMTSPFVLWKQHESRVRGLFFLGVCFLTNRTTWVIVSTSGVRFALDEENRW